MVHRGIDREFFDEAGSFDTCLWVPAGGFKASEDRASVDNPVLVTEWEPLP